ncbi:uncharacterized protein LOC127475927 isoform X4 [Manacus candei]|uniref:uncharacterized protein LOC127475927 isoform X4 n=1 Tax=Manacus candei TaxID=415023 RepID=UPI002227171D|nr:uncharacterized protein LOC127475927 isoform X4 [Manacus candei]
MISFSFISFSLTSFSHFPGLEFRERFPLGISGEVSTWNFGRAFHPEFWERFPAGILGELSTQNFGSGFHPELWERFPPGNLGVFSTWNFGRGFHPEFWEKFPPRILGEVSTPNFGRAFQLDFWEKFPLGILGEISCWDFGRGFHLEFREQLEWREVLQDRGAELDPWNALGALWSRVGWSNPCGWSCPFPGTGGDTPGAELTPGDDPYGRSLWPPGPQIPGFRWNRTWLWETRPIPAPTRALTPPGSPRPGFAATGMSPLECAATGRVQGCSLGSGILGSPAELPKPGPGAGWGGFGWRPPGRWGGSSAGLALLGIHFQQEKELPLAHLLFPFPSQTPQITRRAGSGPGISLWERLSGRGGICRNPGMLQIGKAQLQAVSFPFPLFSPFLCSFPPSPPFSTPWHPELTKGCHPGRSGNSRLSQIQPLSPSLSFSEQRERNSSALLPPCQDLSKVFPGKHHPMLMKNMDPGHFKWMEEAESSLSSFFSPLWSRSEVVPLPEAKKRQIRFGGKGEKITPRTSRSFTIPVSLAKENMVGRGICLQCPWKTKPGFIVLLQREQRTIGTCWDESPPRAGMGPSRDLELPSGSKGGHGGHWGGWRSLPSGLECWEDVGPSTPPLSLQGM